MSPLNSPIEEHYSREHLFENILIVLRDQGITNITRKDIAGVDEFHIRGAAVSKELAKECGFDKSGAARWRHACYERF